MVVVAMPGVTEMTDHMSRPLGISFNCVVVKLLETLEFWVSTKGASPVTTTVCCWLATPICTLMAAVKPTLTLIWSRTTVAKPADSKVSL